jgi:signal transduction histidine kinase/CHASE3 domain sensor protein
MSSQRLFLAAGIIVLLAISGASIALDFKARSDEARVNQSLEVMNKFSETRLLIGRAQRSAGGYVLGDDRGFLEQYRRIKDQIAPVLADLKTTISDNPSQLKLFVEAERLIAVRMAGLDESIRLHAAGETAAATSLFDQGEGRALMEALSVNFDRLAAEERQLLTVRSAQSHRTGDLLLAIDLLGIALIMVISAILIREGRRLSLTQQAELHASEMTNRALEAAVAERTRHLVEAHETLRQSTAVLNSTFATMAEAVLVVDTRAELVLSNLAAEKLFRDFPGGSTDGAAPDAVEYQSDGATLLAPYQRPAARALRGEQFDSQELALRRPGSADLTYALVSGRPLFDGSGAICGAALIYHDITAVREAERKLHQSQKLEAIGKLTGGVAHDFNNMLTVIAGTIEILVARFQGQPDLLAMATLIDRAAERCSELIRHLLAFARKQPLQPRNVDLNDAVRDIAKLLRPTLGEQVEFEAILEPELATAFIDPSQLASAVLNLAINARDAMPNGGKLTLKTRQSQLDEAYARNNPDVTPGDYLMIAVSDTGTGMSPETCERVFEPFFTTKGAGKGSGLGLSMVYGFVKQSRGHIKIYSEVGHGTTIKLYLPRANQTADALVAAAAPTAGGSETILVVEDDALVRGFAIEQLHSLGYRTIAAADSGAALACVAKGVPFDLLFTDVIMPGGMTGRELATQILRSRPGTKVLYTSGYTEDAIVHHGRLDQGVLLLSKPYRKSALASMVRRAMESAAA